MSKTIQFAIAEALTIHAICDRALVPREIQGELLSMAQRVHVLERCYAGMVGRAGMDAPTVNH